MCSNVILLTLQINNGLFHFDHGERKGQQRKHTIRKEERKEGMQCNDIYHWLQCNGRMEGRKEGRKEGKVKKEIEKREKKRERERDRDRDRKI